MAANNNYKMNVKEYGYCPDPKRGRALFNVLINYENRAKTKEIARKKTCDEAHECKQYSCYWWKKNNGQIPGREQGKLEMEAENIAALHKQSGI